MGEVRNRSVRLDEENWEWLSRLPGRTLNEAVTALRKGGAAIPTLAEIRSVVDEAVAPIRTNYSKSQLDAIGPELSSGRGKATTETFTRTPRQPIPKPKDR